MLHDSVHEVIYELYLDGFSRHEVLEMVGPDFWRSHLRTAARLGEHPLKFDLIDYVLSQRPVCPVQQWEDEASRRCIDFLRSEK